jgi:hypothetical protein
MLDYFHVQLHNSTSSEMNDLVNCKDWTRYMLYWLSSIHRRMQIADKNELRFSGKIKKQLK